MTGTINGKSGQEKYFIDGEEVSKRFFDLHFPDRPISYTALSRPMKPKLSDALAYHPRQVAEARAYLKKCGVPTEIVPDGRPIIRSRAHQKALLKLQGYRNNDGGYGD